MDLCTEFQNDFDLKKQIEGIAEPYRASKSERSDNELLKKNLHRYHAAHISRENL